ncbi:MAG: helix-turn-helix domain-containing protein [Sedimentisphaerales bacterium]
MNKLSQDILANQQTDTTWPPRPDIFNDLLTPIEAAQYLRLDETGIHTPQSAIRILNYWRNRGELKATKFARRVWYRKTELDRFLAIKTES